MGDHQPIPVRDELRQCEVCVPCKATDAAAGVPGTGFASQRVHGVKTDINAGDSVSEMSPASETLPPRPTDTSGANVANQTHRAGVRLMPQQTGTAQRSAYGLRPFSLCDTAEQALPNGLVSAVDGRYYPIDADFRTVLGCLRRLSDPNRSMQDKQLYVAARFYLRHPPLDMDALFAAFVLGGQPQADNEVPLLDFEVDAGAIYASFWQQYNIDLLQTPLHWLVFYPLLAGLGETTPLGARVRLRAMDETDLPPHARAAIRNAKERIAIPTRLSKPEQALLTELNERLAAGEDPAEIIGRLQEV